MDPLTQGLLGAAAAQAALTGRRFGLGRGLWLYGALGGMAADLDVFIRSDTDPLVAWVYHRHFTHSLAFIPIGGLVAALPFVLLPRNRERKIAVAAATTVGYATHALLDAFTSYGTQLWWPFSSARVAWDVVAIIDPIYTGMLAVGVVLAARRQRAAPALIALLLSCVYLGFCGLQRSRAAATVEALADRRGHAIERMRVMPEPLTNIVWRSLYEHDDGGTQTMVIDTVRVPWWGASTVYEGSSARKLVLADLPAKITEDAELREAVETFRWFADDWVVLQSQDPWTLGDLRYGSTTQEPVAMWGLVLRPGEPRPVEDFMGSRDVGVAMERWKAVLWGEPLPRRRDGVTWGSK